MFAMLKEAEWLKSRKAIMGIWAGGFLFASAYLSINFLPVGNNAQYTISGLAYLIPPLLAVFGTYLAFKRTTTTDRKFWLFLSLANVSLLIGEIYWIWIEIFKNTEPIQPSFADLMFFISYVFLFLSLISMPRFEQAPASTKIRYLMDLIIIMLFSLFVVWYFILKPLYMQYPNNQAAEPVINLLYPVFDIGIIFGIISNLKFKKTRWAKPEIIIVLGLSMFAIGNLIFGYFAAANIYQTDLWSSLLDLAWLAGYFLFFMAAVYQLNKPQEKIETVSIRKLSQIKWIDIITAVFFIGAVLFLMYTTFYHAKNGLEYWTLTFTAIVITSLIIVREAVIVLENNRLLKASLTDPVSGLYNRQFFDDQLLTEIAETEINGQSLCLAVLDIDNFNDINQIYGSEIANALLKFIANQIRAKSKHIGLACSIGKDDFGLIIPRVHSIDAYKACVEIKIEVKKKTKGILGLPISLSAGIASVPSHARTREGLISKAYGALYWAKFHGKNQVFIYDPELIEGPDILQRKN